MAKHVSLFDFYLAANSLLRFLEGVKAQGLNLDPDSEVGRAALLIESTNIHDIDASYAAAEAKLDAARNACNVRDQILLRAKALIDQALEIRIE